MNFIPIVIYFQCFFVFGFCQNKYATSLVLEELSDGEFHLKKPNRFDPEANVAHFKALENEKVYLFCESSVNPHRISILHNVEKIRPNTEFHDLNKCEGLAKPIILKIDDAAKSLYHTTWDSEIVDRYHSGYMIQTKIMGTPAKNEDLYSETVKIGFLEFIFIYHHKEMKHTVAVEYTLFSTDLPHDEAVFNTGILATFQSEKIKGKELLEYALTSSPKYVKLFKGKIKEEWITIMSERSKENPFTYLLFAPAEHFPLPLWRRTCNFKFNVFPIWKKSKLTWNKVDTFARIVAKHLGNLRVTVGITGIMTLSEDEVVDKYGFKLPRYLWKCLEYVEREKHYGIIVVMNYNPFEKTENKLCEDIGCERNGWIVGNEDFQTGEVYCCAMTKQNIENLSTNFIQFKETEMFDLSNWGSKINIIKEEFKNDMLNGKNPLKRGLKTENE